MFPNSFRCVRCVDENMRLQWAIKSEITLTRDSPNAFVLFAQSLAAMCETTDDKGRQREDYGIICKYLCKLWVRRMCFNDTWKQDDTEHYFVVKQAIVVELYTSFCCHVINLLRLLIEYH